MARRRLLAAWTAISLLCASLPVTMVTQAAPAGPSAAEKETARSLMKAGRASRDKGDHKAALESFKAADAIMKVPTTGLEVGREQVALGLLVEARDTFLKIVRIPVEPKEP